MAFLKEEYDDRGEAVIQHTSIKNFQLASGTVLPQAQLGYCVFGKSGLPIIILHPALTGSPVAYSPFKQTQGKGWWGQCVGPGKFLDTNRFRVVCCDHLGGNGDSTGAKELGPKIAKELTFEDTISLVVQVLKLHGVRSIHAVVGGSIGGAQALLWLFQDQIAVGKIFEICGNSSKQEGVVGRESEFFQIQVDILGGSSQALDQAEQVTYRLRENSSDLLGKTREFDLVFQHILKELGQGITPENALSLARKIGFLRFVTPLFFQKKWRENYEKYKNEDYCDEQLLSWIDWQGTSFCERFQAESLAQLCQMEVHAKAFGPEEVARQLSAKQCHLIGFAVNGDELFNADKQFTFYKEIKKILKEEEKALVDIHFAYDIESGHDHFLTPQFLKHVPQLARHLGGATEVAEDFATKAIHEAPVGHDRTGALIPPIYLTSTFQRGNEGGFDYTRSGNPNFRHLEHVIGSLEEAKYATVFSSGVAAITAIVSSLSSGDLVLAEEVIYGCTYRLFDAVFHKFGVRIEYIDFSNPDNFALIAQKRPKLVWVESPTNPLLKIIDIKAISKYTEMVNSTLVVDNTFASSFFQRPLELGADISLSSTTKYINGHSDCLGGVVATNEKGWHEKMVFAQKALGLNPSPFDAWLITRGLKTLSLRMERHSQNAIQLAQFFETRSEVKRVYYPFLESHPQYAIAKSQMKGGSGIIAVDFDFNERQMDEFLSQLHRFTLAESLGGIESLVCRPALMSHASVPVAQREKLGITMGLIRFSVGIENGDDLLRDLNQAFEKVRIKALKLDGEE
jgi:cystathionine beta-lyase/cystathionine gamma-synthase/homoserine acetyltransferase